MKIKAVIFDLDGVIVSTDECHYQAWKKIADAENIEFDKKVNERLRGVDRMKSLEILLENAKKTYSAIEKQRLAELKNKYYIEMISQLTSDAVMPGVKENLIHLKENGIKIAIGSSSKNTPMILRQIGLEHMFHAVSDGNNITKSKPDPEVFLKAADMLKIPYAECMVVEDADAGITAGKMAGMTTLAVNQAKGGDYHYSSLKEVDILSVLLENDKER